MTQNPKQVHATERETRRVFGKNLLWTQSGANAAKAEAAALRRSCEFSLPDLCPNPARLTALLPAALVCSAACASADRSTGGRNKITELYRVDEVNYWQRRKAQLEHVVGARTSAEQVHLQILHSWCGCCCCFEPASGIAVDEAVVRQTGRSRGIRRRIPASSSSRLTSWSASPSVPVLHLPLHVQHAMVDRTDSFPPSPSRYGSLHSFPSTAVLAAGPADPPVSLPETRMMVRTPSC